VSKLNDKTALVTGSSRGIGRGIAERLGRDGALVAVHYSTGQDAAEQTVKTITAAGGRAFTVQAELGVPGDVDTLFDGLTSGLKEHAGKVELDILVNSAGIMGGVEPDEITPELFDRLVAVNAKAPLFIVQRALSIMPDGGRIINISSGLTKVANPQEIAYAMTKGAVEMISLHYARHLGPRGITVNSVAPGVTNNGQPVFDIPEAVEQMSELSAFGRVGEPSDIADVVAFLASDDGRWVTGAFIDASGGSLLG
jgi:bifunctional oxygenase/reductase